MPGRDAFKEWDAATDSREFLNAEQWARAAFEAGARSRDAEVEALKQERNEYQFDAQVALPELGEYVDHLRQSLREVLDGIDSTAGTPSQEVKRLARATLGEEG